MADEKTWLELTANLRQKDAEASNRKYSSHEYDEVYAPAAWFSLVGFLSNTLPEVMAVVQAVRSHREMMSKDGCELWEYAEEEMFDALDALDKKAREQG